MTSNDNSGISRPKTRSLISIFVPACFASLTVLLLFHFCLITPAFGFGFDSLSKLVVWLLYTLPPLLVAFTWLFCSSLLRNRRGAARAGLLLLISCGLVLGVVIVLWLILVVAFAIAMHGHQGGL